MVYDNGAEIKQILKKIRREGKHLIPKEYELTFEKALLTFKFQRVYCPERKRMVHLNDPETHPLGQTLASHENLDFLGKEIEEELIKKIARCQVDPETHQNYEEMILGRRKLETEPTKVVFKKNTNNKKGIAKQNDGNQRLTKFFGVKN